MEYPLLAITPAAGFAVLYSASKNRLAMATAAMWFLYVPYEYAAKFRLICSGECNIRVDLLLIYPALVIVSVIVLVQFARRRGKRA